MSNVFDQIAKVSVGIQTAVISSASFGKILIVGALPKVAPAKAPALVGYYESIDEVTAAGWVATGDTAALDPVGVAAQVAFSQNPRPEGIYIAPVQVTTVEESTTAESAVITVQRAMETDGWYVVCPVGLPNTDLAGIAAYIEKQEKMMLYNETAFFGAGTGGTNTPTVSSIYTRSGGIFAKESSGQEAANVPAANLYGMAAGFAAVWLSHQSGSETAAYKQIRGVYPSTLSIDERTALADANLSFFVTIANKNVTMIGKVLAGEWLDIIRFRDWIKNDIQLRLVNLFLTGQKIPYVDGGITMVQNCIEAALKEGQLIGGIAPDEYDEDGNETLGFEVNVPTASSVAPTVRAARLLPDVSFRARLAGAIHVVEVTGTLAYAL